MRCKLPLYFYTRWFFYYMAATIYLYDGIGDWGISSIDFADNLQRLKAAGETEFILRINSQGGSVFHGYTIYNLIKDENVTVVIDGVAASIASVIAMAGKKITMQGLSSLMIHNPWMMAAGDKAELEKAGLVLDMIQSQIQQVYADRTGKDLKQIKAWMDAEKYFTPAEAKAAGFVDEISNDVARKDFVAMYVIQDSHNTTKGEQLMNELLLKFLGLPKDATEEQVKAKLAGIRKQMNLADDATVEQIIAAAVKVTVNDAPAAGAGMTDLEKAVKEMQAQMAQMTQANADARVEELVNGAIASGKITPAQKDVFVLAAKADFAKVKAQLDTIKAGSALPGKVEPKDGDGGKGSPKDLVNEMAVFLKAQQEGGK